MLETTFVTTESLNLSLPVDLIAEMKQNWQPLVTKADIKQMEIINWKFYNGRLGLLGQRSERVSLLLREGDWKTERSQNIAHKLAETIDSLNGLEVGKDDVEDRDGKYINPDFRRSISVQMRLASEVKQTVLGSAFELISRYREKMEASPEAKIIWPNWKNFLNYIEESNWGVGDFLGSFWKLIDKLAQNSHSSALDHLKYFQSGVMGEVGVISGLMVQSPEMAVHMASSHVDGSGGVDLILYQRTNKGGFGARKIPKLLLDLKSRKFIEWNDFDLGRKVNLVPESNNSSRYMRLEVSNHDRIATMNALKKLKAVGTDELSIDDFLLTPHMELKVLNFHTAPELYRGASGIATELMVKQLKATGLTPEILFQRR